MASIEVSDEVYQRLVRRAASEHTTVENIVTPMLDYLANENPSSSSSLPTLEERRRAFAEWMAVVAERAGRYPDGFVVDDSRESIYAGRGE
jgi:hypothetical protein